MTQPVQEPTQGRADQAQEFRTRQLFRRPASAPAGSGGSPSWGYVGLVGTAITGTQQATFSDFFTTNQAVFGTSATITPETNTVGDEFLWLKEPGIYHLEIQMIYPAGATDNQFLLAWTGSFVSGPPPFWEDNQPLVFTAIPGAAASVPSMVSDGRHPWLRTILTVETAPCKVYIELYNASGGSIDVTGRFRAVHWPSDTTTTTIVYYT